MLSLNYSIAVVLAAFASPASATLTPDPLHLAAMKSFHREFVEMKLMGPHQRALEEENKNDGEDDQYEGDGSAFNMDCGFQDDGTMLCSMAYVTSQYELYEDCYFSYGALSMVCNVCSTDLTIENDDESNFVFCFDLYCDTDAFTGGSSMEESCSCQSASVNGESWYVERFFCQIVLS